MTTTIHFKPDSNANLRQENLADSLTRVIFRRFVLFQLLIAAVLSSSPGCITFGRGTKGHPRLVEMLPGVSSLSIDTEGNTVTVAGELCATNLSNQFHGSKTLCPGEKFTRCAFNVVDIYQLNQIDKGNAVFDFHQRESSCISPILVHRFETIAVAPYGPEVPPPADPEPK